MERFDCMATLDSHCILKTKWKTQGEKPRGKQAVNTVANSILSLIDQCENIIH